MEPAGVVPGGACAGDRDSASTNARIVVLDLATVLHHQAAFHDKGTAVVTATRQHHCAGANLEQAARAADLAGINGRVVVPTSPE
ncbi:hypothetical protein D3C78_1543790 [compost metagenome]